ncbi:MAG: tandem-95 repeat protein [Cocleimonas sp.]|nr:tandem-95 repeat protein [Cocleimonas sp.]
MNTPTKNTRKLRLFIPLFCSLTVLVAGQSFAGPSVSLNADAERGNIAESGHVGYVGGSTRIGMSIDKNMQGQVDINQIVAEDNASTTSVEGWFGYQIKDKNGSEKGIKGGGVKLNHLWADGDGKYQGDAVHKVFGAYDKDANDHAKITAGYGQEQHDLFWSGHVSKGISEKQGNGTGVATKAYDYGVGGEVGTFFEESLTRIRGALDYEWGTDQADHEDKPMQATISAGVQQYFYDSSHSVTFDVSTSKKSGGKSVAETTASNARLGYQYEFGKNGTFQSNSGIKRVRIEVPGTPAIASVQGRAAIPAIPGKPAKYAKKTIKKPYTKLIKTTMKLENETFFKLNSSKLTASAKENLLKISAEIRRNRYKGSIRITGNTCGLGDAAYDQRLSERRAHTIRKFLIREGFNPTHLIARGLGKNHPKYRNNPQSGFKNRRVDIEYVTERSTKKKMYKTEYKNVLISAATPSKAGRPGSSGRVGVAATPARFIWKTERIKTAPIWIKRALRNPIRHKRSVDTYQTSTLPPITPVDDYYTLTSREEILDILGNDGTGLTLTQVVAAPAHGTAVIVDGKIKYTANADYTGDDRFTYEVEDAYDKTQTAIVYVVVPEGIHNVAPIAVNDELTTTMGTPVSQNIIANDTDADPGDILTLTSISDPSFGSVIQNGNTITYTPEAGSSGTDTFTYIVSDANGHEATATVTIIIHTKTNRAPDAVDDSFTTNDDTSITYDVLNNDSDPDGDNLIISTTTDADHGTVEILNGKIKYTPVEGYTGYDHFTYTISDGKNHTDTATVKVSIEETEQEEENKAPEAKDDLFTTYVNTAMTYDVIDNDHDDDDDDTLTISTVTDASHGTAEIVNNEIKYTPKTGYTGSDSFTYTITDNKGHSATATVTVTIEEEETANKAPEAKDDSFTTSINTTMTYDVIDNDHDDDGDNLIISTNTYPTNGSVTIVNNKIVYTPKTDYVGTDSFKYSISDNHGHTATATVNLTIIDSGTPNLSPNYAATYGHLPVTIRVLADDTDPDGDTLTLVGISTAPTHGTAVKSGNNVIYTATRGYVGTDTFMYDATDNNGHTVSSLVTIDVKQPMVQHVGTNDIYMQVDVDGQTKSYDLSAEISDMDDHPLTISLFSQPSKGSANITGNTVHYTPTAGSYAGADIFEYQACDNETPKNCDTASIFVSGLAQSNAAPVITTITRFSVRTGVTTALDISAFVSDADLDGVYLSAADALSGSLTFNGLIIHYTPEDGASYDDINIEVRDDNGGIANSTIAIRIN